MTLLVGGKAAIAASGSPLVLKVKMQTCWCLNAPVGIWELGSFTYHFKTSDLSRTWHQAWMGGHIKPSVAIGECPLKSSESKMCKTRALGWMESFRACRSSGVDDDEALWPCPWTDDFSQLLMLLPSSACITSHCSACCRREDVYHVCHLPEESRRCMAR